MPPVRGVGGGVAIQKGSASGGEKGTVAGETSLGKG